MKILRHSRKLAAVGLIALLCVSTAYAAFDAFLKLDGIDGESKDSEHKDWIEVLSFSWGLGQATTSISPLSSGRATIQPITITKPVDKSSPKLFEACATGKHIPKLTLELTRTTGQAKQKYLKFVLSDVIVTSVQIPGTTANEAPLEQVTFNFAKIEWAYTAPDQTTISGGWDVKFNQLLPSAIVTPTPTPIPDAPTIP